MAGTGRTPKPAAQRRNAHKPIRGEWQATPGVGWQHGAIPKPPDGLLAASIKAWNTWMTAWFASHWLPADLPGLETVITLFDATRRGELQRSAELRMSMDNYGITPKGQQDRRWAPPKAETAQESQEAQLNDASGPYAHLRALPNPAKTTRRVPEIGLQPRMGRSGAHSAVSTVADRPN